MLNASLLEKLTKLPWLLLFAIVTLGAIGVAALYSAGGPNYAFTHAFRFAVLFVFMIAISLMPIRFWGMLAYPLYLLALILLFAVFFLGVTGGGATRWLSIGGLSVQPSEIMKIAMILAVAKYFHSLQQFERSGLWTFFWGACLIGIPTLLILVQPDLGTSIALGISGAAMIFFAGLRWRYILIGIFAGLVLGWGYYQFGMTEYQHQRIETFFSSDDEGDDRGSAYQINQAKITIGSGGAYGKGYLAGQQTQNEYVPEQHTDFIFTAIAEELGFVGSVLVLLIYAFTLMSCLRIGGRSEHVFGRIACAGVMALITTYVVINIYMVMGMLPVVGVPLLFISHGGTAMFTGLVALAAVISTHMHSENHEAPSQGLL